VTPAHRDRSSRPPLLPARFFWWSYNAYALSRHSGCEPDILSESLEVATSIKITHVDVLSTLIVSPSQSTQQHEFRSIRKSILLWYRLVCVTMLTIALNSSLQYPILADFIEKFPLQAGCIYSTYTDLALCECS
jgi:hypothetical protein